MNRPLILIAEDLDSNFLFLKIVLSKHYNLLHAKEGEEAISLFKKHSPDLILMDMKMPRMGGVEATREIRKICLQTPIIAQTAHAFECDFKEAMEAGCNDVITKPIQITKLKEMVAKYLQNQKTEDQ